MSEQDIHLQRLFKILSSSQATAKRPRERRHVNYGKVQGMSTRQRQREISERHPGGLRHTAMHDVEAKERSQVQHGRKTHPRSPTPLGISAVMVQDMSGKRINDYPFDLERMNLFRRRHGALTSSTRPPARLPFHRRQDALDSRAAARRGLGASERAARCQLGPASWRGIRTSWARRSRLWNRRRS